VLFSVLHSLILICVMLCYTHFDSPLMAHGNTESHVCSGTVPKFCFDILHLPIIGGIFSLQLKRTSFYANAVTVAFEHSLIYNFYFYDYT